ncbi:MAG: pyridoxine 5'-phosphate synthase, partial [Myxococcota bacterium]|nr:pyridoxine 5'-phosphate synthase [Myxococcota bacterium]
MESERYVRLGVNVDHVATIRQARGTLYPDPVTAAAIAELAGADQITVHLREDRRHIQDRDVRILRSTVQTRLNLEMAVTQEMMGIALDLRPDTVTLVPEKREEQTTEGGLDAAGLYDSLAPFCDTLMSADIAVSLFIDPDTAQVEAAARLDVDAVELHTGDYAEAPGDTQRRDELGRLARASSAAYAASLGVIAGHGLDYT